jgi:hypothetical protein
VSYQPINLTLDPNQLAQDAYTFLQSVISGWTPADGNLDVWLIQALAATAGELAETASTIADEIYIDFGTQIMGIQPLAGTSATVSARVILQDPAPTGGYVLPVTTEFQVLDVNGGAWTFVPSAPVTVAAGATQADFIGVSETVGTVANGILPQVSSLVQSNLILQEIDTLTTSTGGVDSENASHYLNRLSAELKLMGPRPILPNDFSQMALNVPGISYAMALDEYDPSNPTVSTERFVTVVCFGPDGQAAASTDIANCQTYLDSLREVTFVVRCVPPTETPINVVYDVEALGGWDPVGVKASIDGNLTAWLTPVQFSSSALTTNQPGILRSQPVVRFYDAIAIIENTEGVDYTKTLTLNGGTSDITLSAKTQFPSIGTITGTVDTPS